MSEEEHSRMLPEELERDAPYPSTCQDGPSEQPHLSQRAPLHRFHHHGLVLLLHVEAIVFLLGQDLWARSSGDSVRQWRGYGGAWGNPGASPTFVPTGLCSRQLLTPQNYIGWGWGRTESNTNSAQYTAGAQDSSVK